MRTFSTRVFAASLAGAVLLGALLHLAFSERYHVFAAGGNRTMRVDRWTGETWLQLAYSTQWMLVTVEKRVTAADLAATRKWDDEARNWVLATDAENTKLKKQQKDDLVTIVDLKAAVATKEAALAANGVEKGLNAVMKDQIERMGKREVDLRRRLEAR